MRRPCPRHDLPLLAALAALGLAAPAQARGAPAGAPESPWSAEKCQRYGRAWNELVQRRGRDGFGPAFIERQEAFLASGCATGRDVCPRSPAELAAADALTIAAVNAGIPSTFLPFGCRS